MSLASEIHAAKVKLPTNLNSQALAELSDGLHQRAYTIARVSNGRFLDATHQIIQDILDGKQSLVYGRLQVQQLIQALDNEGAGDGVRPDLIDQRSTDRMIKTNLDTVQSYAGAVAANDPDVVDDYPALELVRFEQRDVPRGSPEYKPGSTGALGWDDRWIRSCQAAGDVDALRAFSESRRMVALLSSKVWEYLGNRDLFPDGLGNNFAPFAWESGMDTVQVSRADAESLGLIDPGQSAQPLNLGDLNESFQMNPKVENQSLLTALIDTLGDWVAIKDGVLTFA